MFTGHSVTLWEAKLDIIVIEFINDADDEFYESCMDSLVRMCLEQDNNPAVMILEPSTEGVHLHRLHISR